MIKNRNFLGVVGLVLLSGCGSKIIGGSGLGTDGSGTLPVAGGGGGPTPALRAVAMTRAQLELRWDEYWQTHGGGGTSGTGGDDNLDPNDLFLRVSDLGAVCSLPTTELSCGGHWEATIALPPAYQQVGVYNFEDPAISVYTSMSETGVASAQDPSVCSWGGGSIGPGAIEVLAIDASTVTFRLTVVDMLWDNDPNGVYTAPRCP